MARAYAAVLALPAAAGTVTGSATIRERIAVPPQAVLEVRLLDVSRADAPSVTLAELRREAPGQPPYRFELTVDPAKKPPMGVFAVRAELRIDGVLRWTTDRRHAVRLDGSDAPVDIVMVAVGRPVSAGQSRPGAALPLGRLPASFVGDLPGASGTMRWQLDLFPEGRYQLRQTFVDRPEPHRFDDIGRWRWDRERRRLELRGGREAPVFLTPAEEGALRKLDLQGQPIASTHDDRLQRLPEPAPIEPRLHLQGMFVYQADAAHIVLCENGQGLPVAMEGDYLALERAYVAARRQPGQRLRVNLEGLITPRPHAEEGRPPVPTLVVERFLGLNPGASCAAPGR